MATGTGLGSLIPVAMALAGIVALLRARASRKGGQTPADIDIEKQQTAAAEMERRMASYLAGRETGGATDVAIEIDEQERRR